MKKSCNKQQSGEMYVDWRSDPQNARRQDINSLAETQSLNRQETVYSTPFFDSQQYITSVTVGQQSAPAEDQSLPPSHLELAPPSYEAACATIINT